MNSYALLCCAAFLLLLSACTPQEEPGNDPAEPAAVLFGSDVMFLKEHDPNLVVLSDEGGNAQVAVSPAMQGRVLTSTASGVNGLSYGWVNRELIASGERQDHMNAFGGEDRFWIGPEGGQFSIFFKQGAPFDLAHWQVPAAFDWEPFEVVSKDSGQVAFHKAMQFVNYSGTRFDVTVDREVRLLDGAEIREALGTTGDLKSKVVAFESVNKITNTGDDAWTKDTGLLSVWILGMFNPSSATTIVVPYVPGPEDQLGRVVNDAYFGKVPPDRLVVKDSVIYFSGDGTYRSKIGLSPARSRSVLGSYDAQNHVLTLVEYNKPTGVTDYVNSMWEIQERPFGGDVVNSYNDGPPAPGAKPLGPFYEMETSSPAAALAPGQSITHVHRTIHIQGPEDELNRIALRTLGVPLSDIRQAFAQ